jgi:hypothetical protein
MRKEAVAGGLIAVLSRHLLTRTEEDNASKDSHFPGRHSSWSPPDYKPEVARLLDKRKELCCAFQGSEGIPRDDSQCWFLLQNLGIKRKGMMTILHNCPSSYEILNSDGGEF